MYAAKVFKLRDAGAYSSMIGLLVKGLCKRWLINREATRLLRSNSTLSTRFDSIKRYTKLLRDLHILLASIVLKSIDLGAFLIGKTTLRRFKNYIDSYIAREERQEIYTALYWCKESSTRFDGPSVLDP